MLIARIRTDLPAKFVDTVRWQDAVLGGLIAAVLLEISKYAFGWYITQFPAYRTIYGALSSIPIFLLWLYIAWSTVLIGAEVAAAGFDFAFGGGDADLAVPLVGDARHDRSGAADRGVRRRPARHRLAPAPCQRRALCEPQHRPVDDDFREIPARPLSGARD
mgnify:CR=1 FL=1